MAWFKKDIFLFSETVFENLSFIFNILYLSSFEPVLNPNDFDNNFFLDSSKEFFNFPLNFLKYNSFSSFVSTLFISSD